jgi:hypothetical protein
MQPNQLAIVTQFIPRGSLFRLVHRSKVVIDPRRRLQMAQDIARGEWLAVLWWGVVVVVTSDRQGDE